MILKSNKGITMITLIITLIILLMLGTTITVNVSGYAETKRRTSFESDLSKLNEAVSLYYNREKKIPRINPYSDIESIQSVKSVNDNDKYYVIDLGKLDIDELNFGRDFDNVAEYNIDVEITSEHNFKDVYIINEQSLTIYYPKGVEYNGEIHYKLKGNDIETEGQGVIYINNKDQLIEFRNRVNNGESFENIKVMLMTDIDLEGDENNNQTWWTPIGRDEDNLPFKGTFEGNNHTISNVYISGDKTNNYDLGFFGCTSDATINNLTIIGTISVVQNSGDTQRHNCAGLIGKAKNNLTLNNCTNNINVLAQLTEGDASGLVALITSSDPTIVYNIKINNCKNLGTITSLQNASGIVAKFDNNKKIKINMIDCTNNGNITAELSAGGSIAIMYSTGMINLEKCINNGTITSNTSSGSGIITSLNKNNAIIEIEKCENNGEVIADNYGGGVIGTIENECSSTIEIVDCKNLKNITSNTSSSGGCIGNIVGTGNIRISNFENADAIKSNQSYAGGCVGSNNNTNGKLVINNGTKNIASINGYLASGGIVGQSINNSKVIIYDLYNTATIVSRNKYAGGLIGYNGSTTIAINNYNSGKVNGLEISGGLIGILPNSGGTIKILNSYNKGQITSNGNVGGIIGKVEENHTFENCIIKNVFNAGQLDTATYQYGIVYLENKIDIPSTSQILSAFFKNTTTLGTNLTVDLGTSKTNAQIKAQAFADLLNNFVNSNPTFDTEEDLNISLKQWKFVNTAYPVFK